MRPSLVLLLVTIGCVDSRESPSVLEISPSELTTTVVDGHTVTQTYIVTAVDEDGSRRDVTAGAQLALADPAFGGWLGAELQLAGSAVGPTQVTARVGGLTASAPLVVSTRTTRFDANVPKAAPAMFEDAIVDASCGPALAYPSRDMVLPRNLGELEVSWSDARDDLFEIQLHSAYRDVRLYTRGLDAARTFYTRVAAADWQMVASDVGPVEMRINGLIETAAAVACTSAQPVRTAAEPLVGTLVVWNTDAGVLRHDLSAPDDAMTAIEASVDTAPILIVTQTWDRATSCFGCALSRDGAVLAVPPHAQQLGSIYDFVQRTQIVPGDDDGPRTWTSAAFTADDTRLVVAQNGLLRVMTTEGAYMATMPYEADVIARDPAMSPDGERLADVEAHGDSIATALIVRSFDGATNTFGSESLLVPSATSVANYAPSWSPDGQWIAFTRATDWGTPDTRASLWVVKADGSQVPVQISAPSLDLSLSAHWSPIPYTADGERFYYISSASTLPTGTRDLGMDQVVMQAFFPRTQRSSAPFHLPFQTDGVAMHLAGWAGSSIR